MIPAHYHDDLEQRISALEHKLATHNHIAEDDEDSMDRCHEADELLTANVILHAKVAALRAENKRLTDICEERDEQLEYFIKRSQSLEDLVNLWGSR